METSREVLDQFKTRGDLRRASAPSLRESDSGSLRVPSDHPLWDLWRFLGEFYGSAFASQYGDEPNATWAHALSDLKPEDYRRGVDLLKHRASSFPPNPAEFLELLGSDNAWERQCHRVIDTSHMLEDKTGKARRIAERKSRWAQLREECGI